MKTKEETIFLANKVFIIVVDLILDCLLRYSSLSSAKRHKCMARCRAADSTLEPGANGTKLCN